MKVAGLLLSLMVGCSCAHAPPAVRPYPAPASDELLASLAAQQKAVRGMSARVRATSWLGGERIRATVNMLVQRDGRLRFEAEVSLQGPVASLATDGTSFALYDVRKNLFSRGPACAENVASLIRIPLAPADIAAVLLGDARLPPPSAQPTVTWDASRGADLLSLRAPDGGQLQIAFRGQAGARAVVAVVRTGADGAVLWQTAYDELESVGGVRLPKLIRFAERNGSFDDGVDMQFKDRTINPSFPPDGFTLSPPPGATSQEVGCGTGT
jgi:outer membrane lipoprotein-sorting protein